jgi:hypothetical protein
MPVVNMAVASGSQHKENILGDEISWTVGGYRRNRNLNGSKILV